MNLRSGPEILKLLKNLDQESKAIIEEIATLAVYSNQPYDDLWNLTYEEKMIMAKVLEKKIKLENGIKLTQEIKQELI